MVCAESTQSLDPILLEKSISLATEVVSGERGDSTES
jgi:hypothetical protein